MKSRSGRACRPERVDENRTVDIIVIFPRGFAAVSPRAGPIIYKKHELHRRSDPEAGGFAGRQPSLTQIWLERSHRRVSV